MNRRTAHLLVSALLAGAGVVLATGKIIYDGEPGLLPLVMIVAGLAWHFAARRRFPVGTPK
ncbi:MAG TPA: hypothetical protein VEA35_15120 [Ramlibacter sp.]|nr:hypothetical protein [Ramlibacter sp.]